MVTYLSFFVTLYFSFRKPHKRITYQVLKKGKIFSILLWNSGDGVIYREDILSLYLRVNKAFKILSFNSSDDTIPLDLELNQHDEENLSKYKNTNRIDISFDFLLPRSGLLIVVNNEQDPTLIPESIEINGRLRGEDINSFVYGINPTYGLRQSKDPFDKVALSVMAKISFFSFLITTSFFFIFIVPSTFIDLFFKGNFENRSFIELIIGVAYLTLVFRYFQGMTPEANIRKKSGEIKRKYNLKKLNTTGDDIDLVGSVAEIKYNKEVFDSYLNSKNTDEYLYAKQHLRCSHYLLVDTSEDFFRFYPSSFIGISYNSMEKDRQIWSLDLKNVLDFNKAISNIVGQEAQHNELMETKYLCYCQLYGGELPKKKVSEKRAFWII